MRSTDISNHDRDRWRYDATRPIVVEAQGHRSDGSVMKRNGFESAKAWKRMDVHGVERDWRIRQPRPNNDDRWPLNILEGATVEDPR